MTIQSSPTVICPGCRVAMVPTSREVLEHGLENVTFLCRSCGTTTVRLRKAEAPTRQPSYGAQSAAREWD